MINRRRPIQSIVAGRKMFSNGGVVPPPMGAPALPMGAPPMGILNSSPELAQAASFSQPPPTLVDSMVNEATAGYGQGLQDSTAMNAAPVTMAHGGLASEDMMAQGFFNGGPIRRRPDNVFTAISRGRKKPISLDERKRLGEAKALEPVVLSNTPAISNKPVVKGTDDRNLYTIESLYNPTDREIQDYRNIYGKADLARRQALEAVRPDRNLLAPIIDSLTKGRLEADASAQAREKEFERKTIEFEKIKALPLDHWLDKLGAPDKAREFFSDPNNVNLVRSAGFSTDVKIDPSAVIAGTEYQDEDSAKELAAVRNYETAKGLFGEFGGDEDDAAQLARAAAAYGTGDEKSKTTLSPAEKRLLESPIEGDAGGLDFEVPDEYGTATGAFGDLMGDEDSREQLMRGREREILTNISDEIKNKMEGKKTKKENERNMKFFMDRFKEAVPEYEGMSESEKWFSVAEAGLRIMAGKSPNAITNIAEGLKGLGPELAKDAKERRAYDRQINLSAAKYGLQAIAAEEAKADALAKEGRTYPYKLVALKSFVDPVTGNVVKKGQAYVATKNQIDDGILQKLPLTFTEIHTSNASAAAKLAKSLSDSLADAKKDKIIGYKEANKIDEKLNKSRESFVHAQTGQRLIRSVIAKLVANPDDITGIEGEAKKFWGDVLNAFGKKKSQTFKNREELELNMKMAFQKLIPVALRNIQAGNSISDRDVKNLANAFIAGGFIQQDDDGKFTFNLSLTGASPEVLVRQLQETNKIFKEAQENALASFDQVLVNLSKVDPTSRFNIQYFRPQLRRMAPALEAYRKRQETSLGTPTRTTGAILNVEDYFDYNTGRLIKPLPKIGTK